MIGFERQRQMFAAQFEPNGAGYIYRNHTVGEPNPVSAADRDRYVANFDRVTRQGFRAALIAAVILLAGLVSYSFATRTQVPDLVFYVAFGAMFALYMMGYFRAWTLPSRESRGRRG